MKKRYSKFFLYSFYVLIISLDIELLIVFVAFLLISFYDYENMPSIIDSYKWIPIVMYLIVMISAFTNLTSQLLKSQGPTKGDPNEDPETIQVRSERKNRIIKLNQISYVESMSDYIIIFMEGEGRIITRERISRLFEKLPGYFIRIHRSYLINKNFIDSYSKDAVIVGGKELPISRTYKKEFFLYLENQDNN
jgi:DNA-binding LytR/AlgR family response regulator